MRELTPKQLKFAHYVAEGLTASEAYRRVYSAKGTKGTQKSNASDFRNHPGVKAYIAQLQKEIKDRAQLTREDVLAKLDAIIADTDVSPTARVQAIKTRNEMTGDNAPQEINVFGLSDLLAVVRKGKR